MSINPAVFYMHLAAARQRLNLAVFEERLHPRLHGKFAKKLGSFPEANKLGSAIVHHPQHGFGTLQGRSGAGVRVDWHSAKTRSGKPLSSVHALSELKQVDTTEHGAIDVGGDVNMAADLLASGHKVHMDQPKSVSTLLNKLAEIVQEAKDKGDKAPEFDLCKVTVRNTNLFCAESKGIPRVKMPQLSGVPVKGSKGDKLPKDDKGGVNLTQLFRDHLEKALGVHISDEDSKASHLRASQIELNGAKVAGMTKVLDSGKQLGGDPRLFVSRDDYIVDGHHRWAANVGHDLEDNKLGDVSMPVARVDMDIISLLDEANRFAADWGIPQAAVGEMVTGEKK